MGDFTATITEWAAATKQRHTLIYRESVQRIVEIMQRPKGAGGVLPVDLGYLRSSIQASLTEMPTIRENAQPKDGQTYNYNPAEISLVINSAEIGDTIHIGYVAAYARRIHFGFVGQDSLGRNYNQSAQPWVTAAAEQWVRVVKEVEAEAYATSIRSQDG